MPQKSLEQEAMDRVRRMYSSFDTRPSRPTEPVAPREQKAAPAPRSEPEPAPSEKEPAPPSDEKPKSLLDIFLKNQDQSLILLLMVLLMKDGGDMNLMLALVYLLI